MNIYHDDDDLDNLRCDIDVALCNYLQALGHDDNSISELDFSEFDNAINNLE
jgi:hypothetical protein